MAQPFDWLRSAKNVRASEDVVMKPTWNEEDLQQLALLPTEELRKRMLDREHAPELDESFDPRVRFMVKAANIFWSGRLRALEDRMNSMESTSKNNSTEEETFSLERLRGFEVEKLESGGGKVDVHQILRRAITYNRAFPAKVVEASVSEVLDHLMESGFSHYRAFSSKPFNLLKAALIASSGIDSQANIDRFEDDFLRVAKCTWRKMKQNRSQRKRRTTTSIKQEKM